MGFGEAIRVCFSKYATFSGRARRAEYWWFFLFYTLVGIIATVIDKMIGSSFGIFQVIATFGLFLPWLSVEIRRFHDIGKSGWWVLFFGIFPIFLILIGIGTGNEYMLIAFVLVAIAIWIVRIIWLVSRSEPGSNEYGENPLGE